jgi:RNA polymerase sigma factor (sigma-70 family)
MATDPLVERAKRGDAVAWNELYRSLAPAVAGYFGLRGARDPDDLTSETFVAVFRNIGTFRGSIEAFRSWVFVIAHRRLIDDRRARGRRPESRSLADVSLQARDDVESDAAAVMSVADVKALCGRLAVDQADVLILRILGDLTIEQIAEVMGKSPGAVKQLQRRGLDGLRRLTKSQQAVPL